MLKTSHLRRPARSLLLLGVCLLILSVLPARPASAANVIQSVDNELTEFTRGTFQRTSLSAIQAPQLDGRDVPGAVQLLPVGELKDWVRLSFSLPRKLSDVGAVSIGTHIFVIGGLSVNGATRRPTAEVWSATIDPTTGAPIKIGSTYWYTETGLPAVAAADVTTGTLSVAARSLSAVAAVQTGPDSGYIYVIGGNIQANLSTTLSSYGVNIATVANGHITSWTAGPALPPDPTFGAVGLQSASALSFAIGGKKYVYLIGGLERFLNGGVFQLVGSKQVYYAEVGAGGQLVKPSGAAGTSVWAPLAPLPIPVSLSNVAGLWDAAAVADTFNVGGSGLYVMGGQFQASSPASPPEVTDQYSNAVYRAVIQTNGTLAWQSDVPIPTLPEGRVGHSGVEFNGTIYLTGGKPAGGTVGQSESAVLSSYVEDDLKLAQIGQSGSSFMKSPNTLTVPRSRHATVVVRATPTPDSPNPAYAYVIAGQGSTIDQDTSDDLGSDTLIMGRIGTSEDTKQTAFAPSGWYYSTPHDTVFTGAQVQEILWSAVITRPADIQLQYRTSTDNDCSDPTELNNNQNWQTVDGSGSPTDTFFSKNGTNQVSLGTPPAAHCFQYRAKLINGAAGLQTTPALLNVSIRVIVPGNPDLKVRTLQALQEADESLTGFNIQIENHSDNPNEPTQPANIESGGDFFVDMFVYGPFTTPTNVTTPTIPFDTPTANDVACVRLPKSAMGKDTQLGISQWFVATDPTCASQPKSLLPVFKNPGYYTIFVAVDTACFANLNGAVRYGCVFEGLSGGETNNIKQIKIHVPRIKYRVNMPIIFRAPS